jgi:hypothetical protein
MVLLEPKCVKQLDIQILIGLYNGFCPPMSIHHAHTTPCKLATLALRFLQPFHTFVETEHVTSISGRESGGLSAGPSMLLGGSPKQAVPTRVCPPLLWQTPGCFSFCLSYYASKGPLLVTRTTFTRNEDQNLLDDSLLGDHVQIKGIGVSAISKKTALLLRKDHSPRSDQPRHFLYQ